MTVYLLLTVEDKCQVWKINVKGPKIIMKIEKNRIFPQEDKHCLGHKRKVQTDLRRSI